MPSCAATFLHWCRKWVRPFQQIKSFLHSQVERIWCSNAAGVASWGCATDRGAGVRHEVPSFLLFINLEYPHGACTVRALQVPTPPTLLHQFFPISLCRNHLILGITRTSCYTSRISCYTALRGRPEPPARLEHECGSFRVSHAEICSPGEMSTVGGHRRFYEPARSEATITSPEGYILPN